MARIVWLTYEDFSGRVGERFDVTGGDGLGLELAQATLGVESSDRGPEGQERRQFSLEFRGPVTPWLAQGTHRLEHPELGDLDIFLVPLGPDEQGMRYEAVFA